MVLQAEEAGRGSFAGAEVARGEDRDPRSRRSQQEQEEAGERVEPQVEGEVREPEREHQLLRRPARQERTEADQRDPQGDQRPQGEEDPTDEPDVVRSDQPCQAQGEPAGDQRQQDRERVAPDR